MPRRPCSREIPSPTPNRPPSEGLQFFGQVAIDGATQVMTVTLKDVDDRGKLSLIPVVEEGAADEAEASEDSE